MEDNITIRTRFQHRRATAARWAAINPVLREGEIGLELDTHRIKFGDGATAWNELPYAARELQPASDHTLGGVVAAPRNTGCDVQVHIDPATHRLFVPAYPHVPPLATVALTNDYNDLNHKPAPYVLLPATGDRIGGIAAQNKTPGYTVEVKKDPHTHKLYVPPGGADVPDGFLPELVIRVIYKKQDQSEHYPNEPGAIQNADIYFQPLCDAATFNRLAPNLCVAMARCTSRHRQRRAKVAGVSSRSTGWHVVGKQSGIFTLQEAYPHVSIFPSDFGNAPCWTYADTPPVPLSDLVGNYEGGWIKFPYDLETVVRRFIYIYQPVDTTASRILPIQTLKAAQPVKGGYVKISCIHNRMSLAAPRTEAKDFYVSLNLGFCFCRFINQPSNYHRFLFGPIAQKRAMVVCSKNNDTILYYLKDPNRKKRR